MAKHLISILLGAILISGCASSVSDSTSQEKEESEQRMLDLSQFKWKSRPLFLLTESPQHPNYEQQLSHLQGQEAELVDRDMVVFHVFKSGEAYYQVPDSSASLKKIDLEQESANSLLNIMGYNGSGFHLVLVGKDGTMKFRDTIPVEMDKIYEIIDAMPMRQAEMEKNNSSS